MAFTTAPFFDISANPFHCCGTGPRLVTPPNSAEELNPGDRVEGLGNFGKPTGEIGTVERTNEADAVVKWDDDGRVRVGQSWLKAQEGFSVSASRIQQSAFMSTLHETIVAFLDSASVAVEPAICKICGSQVGHRNSTFFYGGRNWEVRIAICPKCNPERIGLAMPIE